MKVPFLTVKYFFDVLDAEVWRTLLYRELDLEGDVLNHPGYLQEAYEAGKDLALALAGNAFSPKQALPLK